MLSCICLAPQLVCGCSTRAPLTFFLAWGGWRQREGCLGFLCRTGQVTVHERGRGTCSFHQALLSSQRRNHANQTRDAQVVVADVATASHPHTNTEHVFVVRGTPRSFPHQQGVALVPLEPLLTLPNTHHTQRSEHKPQQRHGPEHQGFRHESAHSRGGCG